MRANDGLMTILLAMVAGLIILSLVCFLTIYLVPDIPINPLSPARATSIAIASLRSGPEFRKIVTGVKARGRWHAGGLEKTNNLPMNRGRERFEQATFSGGWCEKEEHRSVSRH